MAAQVRILLPSQLKHNLIKIRLMETYMVILLTIIVTALIDFGLAKMVNTREKNKNRKIEHIFVKYLTDILTSPDTKVDRLHSAMDLCRNTNLKASYGAHIVLNLIGKYNTIMSLTIQSNEEYDDKLKEIDHIFNSKKQEDIDRCDVLAKEIEEYEDVFYPIV